MKLSVILFIFFPLSLFSQILKIKGSLIDSVSNKALIYASIQLKNKNFGTITNADGQFTIYLPDTYINDSLSFSFIGYYSKLIAIRDFENKDTIVYLKPQNYKIPEIPIFGYDAEHILRKCIDGFAHNYYQKPIMLDGYFREIISDNGHIEKYSEAQLKIAKQSYLNKKPDAMALIDGFSRKLDEKSPIWEYIYFINGTYEALRCDVVKYPNQFIVIPSSKLSFLNIKHLKNYYYTLKEETTENYYIEFRPKSRRASYSGGLIINKKNFALIAYFYSIASSKIESVQLVQYETEKYLSSENITSKSTNYYAYCIYQKLDDKYILHHAGLSYQMLFLSGSKNIFSHFSVTSQIVITAYNKNENPNIPWLKRVKHAESVHKQIAKINNDNFKTQQIIMPEKSIKHFLELQNY